MKPIAFTARCQNKTIREQYAHGVRCFDLRIRTDHHAHPVVAHGIIEYDIKGSQLMDDLYWLDSQGSVYVRVLHEVRTKKQYTELARLGFEEFCRWAEKKFPNIKFWCGRNLYDWNKDYDFCFYPSCEERYSSVSAPHIIDDWWPWLFARLNNRKIREKGTEADILLIDYIDIR